MMRYRAELTGVGQQERPMDTYAQDKERVMAWGRIMLKLYPRNKFPLAKVTIWELVEHEIAQLRDETKYDDEPPRMD